MNYYLKSEYGSLEYSIEWTQTNHLRKSHKGKHWPKATTCAIFKHGGYKNSQKKIIAFAEIIKHVEEKDQLDYALRISLREALKKAYFMKESRKQIWNDLHEYLKTL